MKVDQVRSATQRAFRTFCRTHGELRTLILKVSDEALRVLGYNYGDCIDCSEVLNEDPGVRVIITSDQRLEEDEVSFVYAT